MSSELAIQSRETERLLAKNRRLVEENKMLKREMVRWAGGGLIWKELHLQTSDELAKRNHAYLKTIKGLLSKLRCTGGGVHTSMTFDSAGLVEARAGEDWAGEGGGREFDV